ncbi:MAG: hypothetical protein ISQ19_01250 [PS1 clade bacterium]|uniref:Uncharacterized protein n=1 Tax=PS1 clade bacterium TaxID=2175152 RepID=A0A937L2F7_9PROT|nr:hypothetical protein [PS1 clade bacterium]
MSKFWRLWIDVWCVGIMVFGLTLAAAGFEGYESSARMLLNQLNPLNQPVFNPVERFSIGLMGAVTLGWGLTLFYFFRAAEARNIGNKMYRELIVILVIWNLLDGFISYSTGFSLNIASNLVITLGLLFPLIWNGKLTP